MAVAVGSHTCGQVTWLINHPGSLPSWKVGNTL